MLSQQWVNNESSFGKSKRHETLSSWFMMLRATHSSKSKKGRILEQAFADLEKRKRYLARILICKSEEAILIPFGSFSGKNRDVASVAATASAVGSISREAWVDKDRSVAFLGTL